MTVSPPAEPDRPTSNGDGLPGVEVPAGVGAIVSTEPDSFAGKILRHRHPALIELVRAAMPYGPRQLANLDVLLAEILDGPIAPLPLDAHDHAAWSVWGEGRFDHSWYEVPLLWAETYFYRRLLEAIDFFTPGPWFRVDPFQPMKEADLDI